MFERFTDRARRVIVLAQEHARMLNHDHIGTEHVLLGLIQEGEGVAAKSLDLLGLTLKRALKEVKELVGEGAQARAGYIPFTPRAKKMLDLTLRESLRLGHDYIGTEHLLLGLVREGEGVGAQVIVKMGEDLNRVREVVLKTLDEDAKQLQEKELEEAKSADSDTLEHPLEPEPIVHDHKGDLAACVVDLKHQLTLRQKDAVWHRRLADDANREVVGVQRLLRMVMAIQESYDA